MYPTCNSPIYNKVGTLYFRGHVNNTITVFSRTYTIYINIKNTFSVYWHYRSYNENAWSRLFLGLAMFIFLLKNKSYGMLGGLHIEMVKWCILPLGGAKLMLLLCIDLFLLCTFRLNRLSIRVHVHHIVYTYECTLSCRTILTRPWILVECYHLFLASKQVKMTLFFNEMCIDCVSCSHVAFSR